MNLGDVMPNFKAQTTMGEIKFHEWKGDSWAILFSHPADFTPVCTTELALVAKLAEAKEFEKRGVKVIGLSCNSVDSHKKWLEDVYHFGGCQKTAPYPIIGDEKRELAVMLRMVDPAEKDKEGLPLTCRAVFIIGPDHKLKLMILYPATTGRNFSEILRVIDSLQLTATNKVATPADWQAGGDCMVLPSVKEEDIPKLFPQGVKKTSVPSGKGYLRFTPQPK